MKDLEALWFRVKFWKSFHTAVVHLEKVDVRSHSVLQVHRDFSFKFRYYLCRQQVFPQPSSRSRLHRSIWVWPKARSSVAYKLMMKVWGNYDSVKGKYLKLWGEIFSALQNCVCLLVYFSPGNMLGFEPMVNQRLLPPSFPRQTTICSRDEVGCVGSQILMVHDTCRPLLHNSITKIMHVLKSIPI